MAERGWLKHNRSGNAPRMVSGVDIFFLSKVNFQTEYRTEKQNFNLDIWKGNIPINKVS